MPIIVYTAVLGGIDYVWEPERALNTEYHLFTDQPFKYNGAWIMHHDAVDKSPRHTARYIKTHPHILFPGLTTVWIDGRIRILGNTPVWVDRWMGQRYELAVKLHYSRRNIQQEADEIVRRKMADPKKLKALMDRYKKENYPVAFGLYWTDVLIRKPTAKVKEFNDRWWQDIDQWCIRDQISFPYWLWKLKVDFKVMPGDQQNYCRKEPHRKFVKEKTECSPT
jgi:hypothetical protein